MGGRGGEKEGKRRKEENGKEREEGRGKRKDGREKETPQPTNKDRTLLLETSKTRTE